MSSKSRLSSLGKSIPNLDVRTKMLGFLIVLVVIFFFNDPVYNGLLAIIMGFLSLLSPFDYKKTKTLIISFTPIFFLMILFAGFTFSSSSYIHGKNYDELFSIGNLVLVRGGLLLGITFSLRIIAMVITTAIITSSITIDDFLLFLDSIRVPYEVSLIIMIGLRFIPTMQEKKNQVLQAQLSRGASFNGRGVIGKVRMYLPIMVPLFVSSIIMSNNLSYAMLNRGYGLSRRWTHMRDLKFGRNDFFVIVVLLGVFICMSYLRFSKHMGIL